MAVPAPVGDVVLGWETEGEAGAQGVAGRPVKLAKPTRTVSFK